MTTTVRIPEPFCWKKSYEIGYPNLDEQHEMAFMSITDLCNNPDDKMKLDCMIAVLTAACLTEEVMMKSCNNPDFTNHKMEHDDFIMKLKTMCCPLPENDLHFIKEWLINHIMTWDMKMKNKLYTYPNM